MNRYFSLSKSFIKSLSMSEATGFKKIGLSFLLIVVLFFIFIPFIFEVGVLTYSMTESLIEVNFQSIGLELLCILMSLFIFIFSFNVLLNELYFNENIEHILPFPLKPFEIVASKFTSCFFAENIMSFFIILSGLIGYLFAIGFKWSSFLFGLVGVFTLPIIPMAYTGIVCLFVMYFTKFIKNKESVRQFSMILVFIVLFIFVFSISSLRQFDFDLFIEDLAIGDHSFINFFKGVFPHINLFIDTINNNSIISLLLYILINIVFVFLYLFLSNIFYLDGVMDLNSKNNNTKAASTELVKNVNKKSASFSFISKEFKILFRTPSFFINCIVINIIWPIFVYAVVLILNLGSFKDLGNLINNLNDNNMILYFLSIFGISIIVPCISTISSSSFSREGKHFDFIKYIPFDIYKVIYIKIFVSFIISYIGVLFYTIIFSILAKINILIFVASVAIITFSILLVSLVGVFIDSIQPKLVWEDELNALRENYNTFIVMGLNLLLIGVFLFLGLYYINNNLNFREFYIVLMLSLFILIIFMLLLFRLFGVDNLENQEEL